jgi:endonuclease G
MRFGSTFIILLITIFLFSCSENNTPLENTEPTPQNQAWNTLHDNLGIPYDNDNSDDYIIERDEYIVSYNPKLNMANFAVWHISDYWIGNVDRYSGKWKTDPLLSIDFLQVDHDYFTGSGYDRGHIVPSYERTRTVDENRNTFFTTNLMLQTANLNRGVWRQFEAYCQELAMSNPEWDYYLVAGSIISEGDTTWVDGVAVPDSCYKMIIGTKGEYRGDIRQIDENTEAICVIMPNEDDVSDKDFEEYQISIDWLEQRTGYDFCHQLPDDVEESIEK